MDKSNPAFTRLTRLSPMLAEEVAEDAEKLRKIARVQSLTMVMDIGQRELSDSNAIEYMKELNKMGDVYKKAVEASAGEKFSLTINIPNHPTMTLAGVAPATLIEDAAVDVAPADADE